MTDEMRRKKSIYYLADMKHIAQAKQLFFQYFSNKDWKRRAFYN
jgi:hypothetical protein